MQNTPDRKESPPRRSAPTLQQALEEGTLVLAVDDHPINRKLLERQLNMLGYAAETAGYGAEALEKWKSGRFALVITDCRMPEMSGYDLARAIRRIEVDEARRHTPVIAYSADPTAGEVDACFAAGMDGLVPKPLEMAALASALDRWLPLFSPVEFRASTRDGPLTVAEDHPVDRSTLAEISGGDTAIEREILIDFRGVNFGDAAMLLDALNKRDILRITHASHRIKGASRTIGATALAGICERIERASRTGDWSAIAANRDAFDQELERLNAWLARL